jgi:uncharacterized protein (TIGR00725 family)
VVIYRCWADSGRRGRPEENMRTVIGVMGPGERASEHDIQMAFALGAEIARRGWVLLSGGRNAGVMDAVNRGAKQENGLTIGILPAADRNDGVSSHVDIAIATGMGSARNNINVLSSDVVIICGSLEAGTLSEVALAVKARRPVVVISDDDEATRFVVRMGRGAVHVVPTVADAVDKAADLLDAL